MSKQRDKAQKKTAHKHGGDWGCPKWHHGDGTVKAQRKAHHAEEKKAKRARRRLDDAIVSEEMEEHMAEKLMLDDGLEVTVTPAGDEVDACTGCGLKVHVPEAPPELQDRLPQPGSPSLCMQCGTTNIFRDDLRLRPATNEELQRIVVEDGTESRTGAAAYVELERRNEAMEICRVCEAPNGALVERRAAELPVGSPIVCLNCGTVSRLGEDMSSLPIPDDELEDYIEAWPGAARIRWDAVSAEFTDGSTCPGCHTPITDQHGVNTEGAPVPGAISACGICGALAIYTMDMRLRLVAPDELRRIKASPETIPEIREVMKDWEAPEPRVLDTTRKHHCPKCSSLLVSPAELRRLNVDPNDTVVCEDCGEILNVTEDWGVEQVDEEAQEHLLKEYPLLQSLQNDARAEKISVGSVCPVCAQHILLLSNRGDQVPPPGTPCYCTACASVLIFTAHGGLRAATPEERKQTVSRPDLPETVRQLMMSQGCIETAQTDCPWCGSKLGLLSSTSYETPAEEPSPGDATICDYCGGLLIFIEGGTARKATDEERAEMLESNPELQAVLDQILVRKSFEVKA